LLQLNLSVKIWHGNFNRRDSIDVVDVVLIVHRIAVDEEIVMAQVGDHLYLCQSEVLVAGR
jgi:hypothetical protein